MSIFVGLDCGGSSSRVIGVDSSGEILFQGQSGAANLLSTPEGRIRKNLGHATSGCPQPDYVCGCFAGLINDTVRTKGLQLLGDLFPKAQLRAEPDYFAALLANPETDVCVVSGTGSLVCSRRNGIVVKSGGRGYILGDEGSGFQFGRDALLNFLDRPKDVSPGMERAITEIFGSTVESELVSSVYRAPSPATILAKLAKPLAQDASNRRPYAVESVRKNLGGLVRIVSSHIDKNHAESTALRVSLAGGIWKAGSVYKDTFQILLEEAVPGVQFEIQKLNRPPLHGAVELAKEMSIGN